MAFEDTVITKFTVRTGDLDAALSKFQGTLGKSAGAINKVSNAAKKNKQASDKMTQGLNKNASSGMRAGKRFEELEKQIGRMERGFRRAAISLTTGNKFLDMLSTRFDRASLMMWKFTMAAIPIREMMMQAAVATGVGVMAIKKLSDEATLIDSTRRAFEKMTGSMEEAGKMVEYLRDQAPLIRYSLTEVLEAGRVLTVAGYDVTSLIHPMGDLAAAINQDGVDIASASRAFVDAMHGEFRRLRNTFDITKEEVREFAGAAINAQGQVVDRAKMQWALLETIQRKYGGANEAMMGTMIGSVSNFNDQLKRLGATLGGFITPALQSALSWGAKFVGRMNEMAESTGAIVGWSVIIGTAIAGFVALGAAVANVAIQFMGIWSSYKIFQQTYTTGQKEMIEVELELAKLNQMIAMQQAVDAAQTLKMDAKIIASLKKIAAEKAKALGFAPSGTGLGGPATAAVPGAAGGAVGGVLSREANTLQKINTLQRNLVVTQNARLRLAAQIADAEKRIKRGFVVPAYPGAKSGPSALQQEANNEKMKVYYQKLGVKEANLRLELSHKQHMVERDIALAMLKQRRAVAAQTLATQQAMTPGDVRERAGLSKLAMAEQRYVHAVRRFTVEMRTQGPRMLLAPLQKATTFLGQRFAHTGRQLAAFGASVKAAAKTAWANAKAGLKSIGSMMLMNLQFLAVGLAIAGVTYLLNTNKRAFENLTSKITAVTEKFKEMAEVVPTSEATKEAVAQLDKFKEILASYKTQVPAHYIGPMRPFEWGQTKGQMTKPEATEFTRDFWTRAGTFVKNMSDEQRKTYSKYVTPDWFEHIEKLGEQAPTASAEEVQAMEAGVIGFEGEMLLSDMQRQVAKEQGETVSRTTKQYEDLTAEAVKWFAEVEKLKATYDGMAPGQKRDIVLGKLRNAMLLDENATREDIEITADDLVKAAKDALDVGRLYRKHLESQAKLRKDELVSADAMEKAIGDSKKQGKDMLLTLLQQQDALDAGKKKYDEYKKVQDALIAAQPARTKELNKQTEEHKKQLEFAQAILDVGMAQLRIEELKGEQQLYTAGGGKYAGLLFGKENIDEQVKLYAAARKKQMDAAQKKVDAAESALQESPSAETRKNLANAQAAYARAKQHPSDESRAAMAEAYKLYETKGTEMVGLQMGEVELGPGATSMEKVANSYAKVSIMEDGLARQKAANARNIQDLESAGEDEAFIALAKRIAAAKELQAQNKIAAENQKAETESLKYYIGALKVGRKERQLEGASIKEILADDIAILEEERKLALLQGDRVAAANKILADTQAKKAAEEANLSLHEQGFKILQKQGEMGWVGEGVVDKAKQAWAEFYLWRSREENRSAEEQMKDYMKYMDLMKEDTESEWGKIISNIMGGPQKMMEQAIKETGVFRKFGTSILGSGMGAKDIKASLADSSNNEITVRVKFEDLAPAMIQGKVAAAMPALMNQFGRELVGVLNA